MPELQRPIEERSSRRTGSSPVILLLSLSTLLGAVAYWRFTVSERFLTRSFVVLERRGRTLTVEKCVDEVLRWGTRCEAMKSLCDASVPRQLEACLAGSDRSAYCRSIGQRYMATEFGVPECRARGILHRGREKTNCALSYRAIAAYCARLAERRTP